MRLYPLLAAALITLSFTACDQMREKTPGEGKPGQYPPSLWDKRDGQVSDEELEAKGFKVGAIIKTLKDPDTREQFKIISLNADGTTVNLLPISAGTEPEKKQCKGSKGKGKGKSKRTSQS